VANRRRKGLRGEMNRWVLSVCLSGSTRLIRMLGGSRRSLQWFAISSRPVTCTMAASASRKARLQHRGEF
jgi:hypothetical protein